MIKPRLLLAFVAVARASLLQEARRHLNLGSIFGSATTSKTPYDRVMGHPVFQVTTPWGAPYMNFEKVDAAERTSLQNSNDVMGPESESRPVTLFYMDPDDAIQMHQEMKQMSNMGNADIRITVTTLAKAIRQASNLGGLVTGSPIEALDGNLKSTNEGGSLRYKIVPPKRQLFYAARCQGKERVGLFGDAKEEAKTFVESSQFVHNVNLERRRQAKERKSRSGLSRAQSENAHMEGYTGIPVFYAPQLKRVHPLVKMKREEMPFFFSYEDLQQAWTTMRKKHAKKGQRIPKEPSTVEVYNLMDVLTSMEREEWKKKRGGFDWKDPVGSTLTIKRSKHEGTAADLEKITFVPPSNCISYKETISAQGNGKARLRPMR